MDVADAMGVFAGANFNTVSQLSLAFGEKEKELDKLKHDLAEAEKRHEQEIDKLKREHEDKVEQWKMKAEELKHHLENAELVNQQGEKKIALVNQHLKDPQVGLKALCFLDMTCEDFKQVLGKLQEEFRQAVIYLYTYFDEMQGLYDKYNKHFETIEDHHDRIKKHLLL